MWARQIGLHKLTKRRLERKLDTGVVVSHFWRRPPHALLTVAPCPALTPTVPTGDRVSYLPIYPDYFLPFPADPCDPWPLFPRVYPLTEFSNIFIIHCWHQAFVFFSLPLPIVPSSLHLFYTSCHAHAMANAQQKPSSRFSLSILHLRTTKYTCSCSSDKTSENMHFFIITVTTHVPY